MVNQADDDDFSDLGAKHLLKAAQFAALYANVLEVDDPESTAIEYWTNHASLLRKLADEWSAPEDGWKDGKIIPWRGPAKMKALPPDRPR